MLVLCFSRSHFLFFSHSSHTVISKQGRIFTWSCLANKSIGRNRVLKIAGCELFLLTHAAIVAGSRMQITLCICTATGVDRARSRSPCPAGVSVRDPRTRPTPHDTFRVRNIALTTGRTRLQPPTASERFFHVAKPQVKNARPSRTSRPSELERWDKGIGSRPRNETATCAAITDPSGRVVADDFFESPSGRYVERGLWVREYVVTGQRDCRWWPLGGGRRLPN